MVSHQDTVKDKTTKNMGPIILNRDFAGFIMRRKNSAIH